MFDKRLLGDVARPDIPKPGCRVILICGPPAAGKTTYVEIHAGPVDIVIDLDRIAREHGLGRVRLGGEVGALLQERNARLAALAEEPPERIAWVIIGAPSPSLRRWWCEILDVRPTDLVLLLPTREELRRRIIADLDRARVREHHFALVDQWLARERKDDPGVSKRGCDASGYPTDPLHAWNR
jgi:5-methylcytosine-specific restriction protein A